MSESVTVTSVHMHAQLALMGPFATSWQLAHVLHVRQWQIRRRLYLTMYNCFRDLHDDGVTYGAHIQDSVLCKTLQERILQLPQVQTIQHTQAPRPLFHCLVYGSKFGLHGLWQHVPSTHCKLIIRSQSFVRVLAHVQKQEAVVQAIQLCCTSL